MKICSPSVSARLKFNRVSRVAVCIVAAACGASLAPRVHAAPTVVVTDGFETTSHPTGTPEASTSPGISFFTSKANGTGGSATITTDTTLSPTNSSVLTVNNTLAGTSYPVVAPLGGTASLGTVGDSVALSFRFRFLNQGSDTAGNSNFRFGLESSNGTTLTGDNQTSISDNDQGYYAQIGDAAQTSGNLFFNEAGGTTPILAGLDRANVAATSTVNTVAAILDNAPHSAVLTLTRTNATTIGLSLSIDGGTAVTGPTTTNLRTSFDEIAFSDGFATTTSLNFAVDDVQVSATTFAVPEPSSAMLLSGFGVAALLRRRRR